jgi:hypothetical protein
MNTVIRIDKNSIFPYISINGKDIFTTKELMQYDLDSPVNDFDMQTLYMNKIKGIDCCFGYGENEIELAYHLGAAGKFIKYDTSTGKAEFVPHMQDDLVFKKNGEKIYFEPDFVDNEGIYHAISGYYFSMFIDVKNNGELNPNIDKINELMALTEDSNPIIFYYEFKN